MTTPAEAPQDRPQERPGSLADLMTPLQLERAMDALGMSVPKLARELGCSRVTVWRWTQGQWPVPDPVAEWLAAMVRHMKTAPTPPKPEDWRQRWVTMRRTDTGKI